MVYLRVPEVEQIYPGMVLVRYIHFDLHIWGPENGRPYFIITGYCYRWLLQTVATGYFTMICIYKVREMWATFIDNLFPKSFLLSNMLLHFDLHI